LSYGPPNVTDQYRRAAAYVDHILHGAKPEDLPVQLPVKFGMAVNVKTAKAIGLTIPESLNIGFRRSPPISSSAIIERHPLGPTLWSA
jgi:putative tryptophan/tyrosine transport system substrate-binding protein